jgi:hypothetical protein
MAAILTLTAPLAVVARTSRPPALRKALRAAASAFDRMVPPPALAPDPKLLPEWFKYPPI